MTIQEALNWASSQLTQVPTASLDARILLKHLLNCSDSQLITQSEETLSEKHLKGFQEAVFNRQSGKPIAYIIQEKEFYERSFYVDERVLIPRPETEEMLEDAFEELKNHPEDIIIDLGTGSGAIAISAALAFPNHQVLGLEISDEALEVAKINHQIHSCENLRFIQSDLLSAFPEELQEKPLTILANLPYIGTESNHFVSEETEAHEPDLALYGGSDGLELYRQTWKHIQEKNLKVRIMYMEIGFSQAEQIEKELKETFPKASVAINMDLAGLPRTAVLSQNI